MSVKDLDSAPGSETPTPQRWIVLGDRESGMSYGPFADEWEAERFAAQVPGRIALTWAGACSQIETCAAYGLPFRPLAVGEDEE